MESISVELSHFCRIEPFVTAKPGNQVGNDSSLPLNRDSGRAAQAGEVVYEFQHHVAAQGGDVFFLDVGAGVGVADPFVPVEQVADGEDDFGAVVHDGA